MTPTRITLSRAKGWRKPAGAIVVARPSIWGNPWAVGTPGLLHTRIDGARVVYKTEIACDALDAVIIYERWLAGKDIWGINLPDLRHFTDAGKIALRDHLHARRQLILSNLHQLRGHDLLCWCKQGHPCHADVLLEMANGGEG